MYVTCPGMRSRPSKCAWESAPRICIANDWRSHTNCAPRASIATAYPAPRVTYCVPCDSNASGKVAAGQATQRSDNERMRRKGKPPERGAETARGDFIMNGIGRAHV